MCATHVPRANLLYSPRNKILAASLLIEAFLYEEQTRRGVSLRHFDEFGDVADHCTVCHKCAKPCPVDIDFGDVSIAMRNLLRKQGKKRANPGTAAAMLFLNATDPATIKLVRKGMIDWGFRAQRLAHRAARALGLVQPQTKQPPATVGKPTVKAQVIHFVNKPMPGGLPKRTARALLDVEDPKIIPIVRDPALAHEDAEAVFYFPGCGSERLFSQVGLATQAMLYHVGAQCVLPPGYLCCGYPQTAAGDEDKGQQISTDNRVLFHRVANTLNYLDIKTVIVSCGTCLDQLEKYEFDKIFPGSRLLDIHEYLLEKGVKLDGVTGVRYMYHDPCHTPIKTRQPLEGRERADGRAGEGERPLLRRVGHARGDAARRLDAGPLPQGGGIAPGRGVRCEPTASRGDVKVLTSCPSCLQGLARYRHDAGDRRRLHRRRDGETPPRPGLAPRFRGASEPRRDREGATLSPSAGVAVGASTRRDPELAGRYFYSDYCAGFIRSFRYVSSQAVEQVDWNVPSVGQVLSFGEDASAGALRDHRECEDLPDREDVSRRARTARANVFRTVSHAARWDASGLRPQL